MKQEKSFIEPQMNASGHEYITKNLSQNKNWRKFAFIRGLIIMGMAFIIPFGVFADEISVDTIVYNANRTSYYQGKDGRAQVEMTIIDKQGRERQRRFTILRRDMEPEGEPSADFTDEQKFYVYFHRPSDVNKTVFLVWKHPGKDDDRWLYLPALDLVNRIAAGDERTSFVGSHFLYEDVSGRGPEEDVHELAETTDNFYVLKNTPKEPDSVDFSYYKAWIHRQTFIPVKVEYYDKDGKKYRIAQALKVDTIKGYPTVMKAQMEDLRSGGKTTIDYSNVEYDLDLPDEIFTERYLRNPPRKYLR